MQWYKLKSYWANTDPCSAQSSRERNATDLLLMYLSTCKIYCTDVGFYKS